MDIGHFPTPYPDELVYSICARYSRRVAYPDAKSVLQELFGSATATAVIDLPNRLRKPATGLPAGTSLTTDRLIAWHTFLPFYSAFMQPERVRQVRKCMEGSSGPVAHMSSGAMASRIPTPDFMKYCPVCVIEDEKQLRETFWHRLHQLPGVEDCPSHQVFLEYSCVGFHVRRKPIQFIPAMRATQATTVRCVDIENRDHRALLQLARDAEWLLEHPSHGTSPKALHTRYLLLLVEHGLATHTGSIYVKRLLGEFTRYYSPSLLRLLHCEFQRRDIEKSNWLLRLVHRQKHAQHPLYHLLLIQFLGCTVKKFFELPEELRPFGEGPWPCLNPATSHYKQPVITEFQLGDRLRYGKPTGKFSCECGFAYARAGPDSSPEDRFRVGRIISFGQIWEAKLKQLWKDSSLSISEIGRRLSVDPLTVRRHTARLGLPLSRSDMRWKQLPPATQLKGEAVSAAREKKRHRCRPKWLSALKQQRELTLKELRCKLPREYAWLLQNDSAWMDRHKPHSRRRNLLTYSVDWKRRDVEYVAAVKAAASRLKEVHSRPVRVTRTAIGRALGAITLLRQKLHKMPLTAQALSGVVETREQYAVRRVWWAAGLYCGEDVLPREWQLVMRANVYTLRRVSEVECAVEGAMSMLRSKLTQSRAERAAS